jgi:hypothetical protein
VGLVRKVDLLSISLGLKTVALAETSSRNSGDPGQNSKDFFLQKTHIRLAKKIFQSKFAFLTDFEARYIRFED